MKIKLYFLVKKLIKKLPSSKLKSKFNTFLLLYSMKKFSYCVCAKIVLKKHGSFCSKKCLDRKKERDKWHADTQRKKLGDKLYKEIYSSEKFKNLNDLDKRIISDYPAHALLTWYKSKK